MYFGVIREAYFNPFKYVKSHLKGPIYGVRPVPHRATHTLQSSIPLNNVLFDGNAFISIA